MRLDYRRVYGIQSAARFYSARVCPSGQLYGCVVKKKVVYLEEINRDTADFGETSEASVRLNGFIVTLRNESKLGRTWKRCGTGRSDGDDVTQPDVT